MLFLDNLEQTTLVSLSDVSVNETIDEAQFVFEVPEDVDVVGTPVIEPADGQKGDDVSDVMSEAHGEDEGAALVTPADDELVHTLPLDDIAD